MIFSHKKRASSAPLAPSAPALLGAVFIAFVLPASADIPRKAPESKYTGLWTNSPFTSKPPAPDPVNTVNPLDDYTLTGISPVPGGYRITIMNKKNPEEKEVIEPGIRNKFTVVSVNRNPDETLGTSVVLSTGSLQGTVTFERDLLTLKAAPAAPQPQPNQNLPPGVTPGQANPQQNAQQQRQPRPRIVAPPQPATQQQQQAQPTNQRGSSSRGGDSRTQRRR